jgi:type IV pilus assembly protein PilC
MMPNCRIIPDKYYADLALLSRSLSKAFSGKLPISRAISSLTEQSRLAKKFVSALRLVVLSIENGTSAFQAFSAHDKIFGTFFCLAIKQGERSGNPVVFFSGLADFFDEIHRFRNTIFNTWKYPAIVLIVSAGVMSTLLTFIVPAAVRATPAHSTDIPLITYTALRILTLNQHSILTMFAAVLSLSFFFWYFIVKFQWLYKIQGVIPFWGTIARLDMLRRISLGLSFLLSHGVNPYSAIEITAALIRHPRYRKELLRAAQNEPYTCASPISALVNAMRIFPQTVLNSLPGEENPFRKMSDFYEEETEVAVTAIALLSEPTIVAIAGLLGGGILATLYLPLIRQLTGR